MQNAVILPIKIEFDRWAAHLREVLPTLSIPLSNGEENWRDWANQLINNNGLSTVPTASELIFPRQEDWREWGTYFISFITLS